MGLLSKAIAEGKNSPPPKKVPVPSALDTGALDEKGKALLDRLLSLTRDRTAPERAIGLLKDYGAFSVGICLALENGFYSAYASVGIGEMVTLAAKLLSPVPGQSFYSVDYQPPEGSAPPALIFRAFPLGGARLSSPAGDLPRYILLLGEDRRFSFRNGPVQQLVEIAGGVLLPPGVRDTPGPRKAEKSAGVPKVETGVPPVKTGVPSKAESGGGDRELLKLLSAGIEKFGTLQGLIIRFSGADISGKLGSLVSAFGTVSSFKGNRCMVLFSGELDGEVLARHLLKTFPGEKLLDFRSADPEEALKTVKPFVT
ncbi:MAG: hypothetical protein LBQ44_03185 [Treponema sp.]|jgi:hypothetical protein|nr:hypothetical protein [Treponema sp.]